MLVSLEIRNFLLIKKLSINLIKGFNTFTGETGAGKSIKEDEIAKNYAAILAYNFPESKWYEKSYNVINELEIETEQENWFKKFNPIRLVKNNKVEENIEIQIIE